MEALDAVVRTGGRAFVFINVRIPRIENRLIVFDWKMWAEVLRGGPIPLRDMKTMPYIKGAKDLFPLEELMEDLCPKILPTT